MFGCLFYLLFKFGDLFYPRHLPAPATFTRIRTRTRTRDLYPRHLDILVSGSLFVSPCPPECYLQSETKTEPDLRLTNSRCFNTL